jgi:hypothetical protein
MPDLMNDSNLNTLVELSEVQFTKPPLVIILKKLTIKERQIGIWLIKRNQVIFWTSSYADFASKLV